MNCKNLRTAVYIIILLPYILFGADNLEQPTQLDSIMTSSQPDSIKMKALWEYAGDLPRGNIEQSLNCADLLYQLGKKNDDSLTIARSYIIKGNVNLVSLSRYDSMRQYAQLAIEVLDTLSITEELARAYNLLGIGNVYLSQYVESMRLIKKSKSIYKELGNGCQEATLLHNIAKLYKMLGNQGETAHHIKDAINLKNKLDCKDNISYMYMNVGAYYENDGIVDSTIKYINQAIAEDKKYGSESELGPSYMILAKTYRKLDMLDTAAFYIDKSIELAERHDNIKLKSFAYHIKARLLEDSGDLAAMEYIEKALSFARPKSKIYLDIIEDKAKMLKKNGRYKEALALVEESQAIKDEKKNVVKYGKLKKEEAKESEAVITSLENEKNTYLSSSKRNRLFALSMLTVLIFGSLYTYILFKRWKTDQLAKIELIEKSKNIALSKSQMELMRTKMNPHFIFNSLNSIKYYFIKNDHHAAVDYLSSFSELIRDVLDNSDKETIPLEDNILWIENYCKLEKKRLNGKLNFLVKESIDHNTEDICIPPMLIQPFVENAIWHGLSPKSEGERNLHITYSNGHPDYITCIIDDNGVGFPSNTKKSPGSHVSLGTRITKDRLAAIEAYYGGAFSYEIIHKKENGQNGTKIVLKLPYIISN